jgi:hypothetical protein
MKVTKEDVKAAHADYEAAWKARHAAVKVRNDAKATADATAEAARRVRATADAAAMTAYTAEVAARDARDATSSTWEEYTKLKHEFENANKTGYLTYVDLLSMDIS